MFKLQENMHSPSRGLWPVELVRFFPTRIGERASANHAQSLPREQPYQICMQSNQRYYAHNLFRRPSWKMVAYGLVPK